MMQECAPVLGEMKSLVQDHVGVRRLDFLPYHFLLASIGEKGILRYQVLPASHCPIIYFFFGDSTALVRHSRPSRQAPI